MRVRLIAVLVPLLVVTMGMVGSAAAAPGGGERIDVIVVLHDGVDADRAAADASEDHGAEVSFIYRHALRGYAASVPAQRLQGLSRNPRVDYVQEDGRVSIQAQTVPTGVERIFADEAALDIDGTDDVRVDVDVAVIDTGIDFEHPDLNVVGGVTCTESGGGPPWSRTASCAEGGDDDHYHGTHVAGTVAALDNGEGVVGVAPGARLHAVKVLSSNGSGSESMVVAGIDWVAANADVIEVANMSLGGSGFSQAEYDAIQGAVDAGVAFAVAAGNDDADARNYSPGSFDNVLSVSALADFDGAPGGNGAATCRSDQDDTLADFSNWGPAIDIAAPGVCIDSTFPIEQGSYGTISGTSMASPHVAGALALLASSDNPGNATDVFNLYDAVTNSGNFEWDDDTGDGTKEPLLDISSGFTPTLTATDGGGGGGGGGGDENTAPTASFTHDCTDLDCTFDGSGSSDSDGSIASYAWSFGDGTTDTGETASHSYASGSTYTVTLTVTDDGGATDTVQQEVTVTEPPAPGDFSLTTTGEKVKGRHHVDLTWSGATSTAVDVYRNGALLTTTANDGSYTDATDNRGGATYTYQVCEAGTTTCSNTSTVIF